MPPSEVSQGVLVGAAESEWEESHRALSTKRRAVGFRQKAVPTYMLASSEFGARFRSFSAQNTARPYASGYLTMRASVWPTELIPS